MSFLRDEIKFTSIFISFWTYLCLPCWTYKCVCKWTYLCICFRLINVYFRTYLRFYILTLFRLKYLFISLNFGIVFAVYFFHLFVEVKKSPNLSRYKSNNETEISPSLDAEKSPNIIVSSHAEKSLAFSP